MKNCRHHSRACLAALALILVLGAPAAALAYANAGQTLDASDGMGLNLAREQDAYSYLCSTIGDSLTDSNQLQGIFYSRLNDPGFVYRSIPGGTQVVRHGMPGGTTGSILPVVRSEDWGAGEGANFVMIMAGTNDLDYNQGDKIEDLAAAMVSNIQAMVDDVLGGNHDPAVRPSVIVSGVPAFLDPTLTARAKYYNNLLRTSLKRVDVFTDAAWWDLYDSSTGAASRDLMDDLKHPNGDGFYRIAEDWFEGVDAMYNPKRFSAENHLYKGDWYRQLY